MEAIVWDISRSDSCKAVWDSKCAQKQSCILVSDSVWFVAAFFDWCTCSLASQLLDRFAILTFSICWSHHRTAQPFVLHWSCSSMKPSLFSQRLYFISALYYCLSVRPLYGRFEYSVWQHSSFTHPPTWLPAGCLTLVQRNVYDTAWTRDFHYNRTWKKLVETNRRFFLSFTHKPANAYLRNFWAIYVNESIIICNTDINFISMKIELL